jgi:peptide subunit release factor 1 (eRF1)
MALARHDTGMPKTSAHLDTPLREQLQKLASFEPQGSPVVSLYLNLAPDQHGRDNYDAFCRKAFAERVKAFDQRSPERASLERDVARIEAYLANELNRSANGLALFASAGEFFEALQLDAPFEDHWLFIGPVPHIYPLVRLVDQYPRYASVLLDTNRARIFVFSLGAVEKQADVTGVKTRRGAMGGWSQARYQRHADDIHLHHVKEVVDTLDRIVRADNIQHIIVAGDEVVVPLLKDALPAHLKEKIADIMPFDREAGESGVVETTLELLRQKDAETDAERVAAIVGAWQAGGLGVAGPEATLRALEMGQVEELVISAAPQTLGPGRAASADAPREAMAAETSTPNAPDEKQLQLSNELVTRAQQTGARIRIIEDAELLRACGGAGATLRFRI